MGGKFYIVAEKILSEAMKKTVQVKDLLQSGEEKQVKEAVKRIGLSRSAYYKYKDYIFPFDQPEREELVTLSLLIVDKTGALSKVLTKIAQYEGSILTINQDLPLTEVAHVTITIKIKKLIISLEELLERIRKIKGIKRVELITQNFKSK